MRHKNPARPFSVWPGHHRSLSSPHTSCCREGYWRFFDGSSHFVSCSSTIHQSFSVMRPSYLVPGCASELGSWRHLKTAISPFWEGWASPGVAAWCSNIQRHWQGHSSHGYPGSLKSRPHSASKCLASKGYLANLSSLPFHYDSSYNREWDPACSSFCVLLPQ